MAKPKNAIVMHEDEVLWKKLLLARSAWNLKQPFFSGCFNWMIPSLYLGNGCFTKHPFKTGCLEYQVLQKLAFNISLGSLKQALNVRGEQVGVLIPSVHVKHIEKKQVFGHSQNGPRGHLNERKTVFKKWIGFFVTPQSSGGLAFWWQNMNAMEKTAFSKICYKSWLSTFHLAPWSKL